jgi:hypothetical protein
MRKLLILLLMTFTLLGLAGHALGLTGYTVAWDKTYGAPGEERAYSIAQGNDGGYALVGFTRSFGAGAIDAWLVKTDANGNMIWNKTYGGTNDDWSFCIVQTSDKGYALGGHTWSFGAGNADFWLIKVAPPIPSVGGEWIPIDEFQLFTSWISLTLTMAIAASFVAIRRNKKRLD